MNEQDKETLALLKGRKIVGIRRMSATELKNQYWPYSPQILILDNGTEITPMRDEEGNGPGVIAIDLPEERRE